MFVHATNIKKLSNWHNFFIPSRSRFKNFSLFWESLYEEFQNIFILFGLFCTNEYITSFHLPSFGFGHRILKLACFIRLFNMYHSALAWELDCQSRLHHIVSKLPCAQGISIVIPVLSLDISCWYSAGECCHAPYFHIISLILVASAILRCSIGEYPSQLFTCPMIGRISTGLILLICNAV